jgi:hypothetical protein
VLEVSFLDYPMWDVLASVDLDGRLPLEYPGNPRVEGRTKIKAVRVVWTIPDVWDFVTPAAFRTAPIRSPLKE